MSQSEHWLLVHIYTCDKKILMLFKVSFIYSIDTDFYSKLLKCKLSNKYMVLLLHRETAVVFNSHKCLNSVRVKIRKQMPKLCLSHLTGLLLFSQNDKRRRTIMFSFFLFIRLICQRTFLTGTSWKQMKNTSSLTFWHFLQPVMEL